jgi:hypothetical protein
MLIYIGDRRPEQGTAEGCVKGLLNRSPSSRQYLKERGPGPILANDDEEFSARELVEIQNRFL